MDVNENIFSLLGQLIMPRLEIPKFAKDESYRNFIIQLIEKKYAGGFCIFGGTVDSLPIILDELQEIAKKADSPVLLMSCDCEWGLPMRLSKGGTEFPHLMALQKMNDQQGIKQVAEAIGIEMSAMGLHWNFAPVADINSNPKNPIINIRAFSGDPDIVAECDASFYEGLESAGIIATAKHFPGHGDTEVDSHNDLPYINKTFEVFDANELIPFKSLSNKCIPSIMTGHIAAPRLAEKFGAREKEKNLPATISPYLTKNLLREHIGFSGVIITDSLEMYGLEKVTMGAGDIASRSFAAGSDMLLMPTDPIAAYNAVAQNVTEGTITSDDIAERIGRINILRNKYTSATPPKITVQWAEHEKIAAISAENALHMDGMIQKPFSPSSVLIISRNADSEKRQKELLLNFFQREFPRVDVGKLAEDKWGNKPLIILLHRPRGVLTGDQAAEPLHKKAKDILVKLQKKNITPIGVIAFGDPYIAEEFSTLHPDFILKSYSDSVPSLTAGLNLLKKNK